MSVYYNEHDPFAAAWLRELIRDGLIADDFVDDRSITDVQPDDLAGFTQCHFFAGIGGWSYALRLAGWPDDRPIWTGSCPCQPFSAAGKRQGNSDDRHLWPQWARLIRECRPDVLAGEQVASAIGHGWLDLVSTDLEAEGYAVGAVVLGAHSVGAPHLRQRLWFVAESDGRHAEHGSLPRSREHGLRAQGGCAHGPAGDGERAEGRVADDDRAGRQEQRERGLLDGKRPTLRHDADGRGADGDMGHAQQHRPQRGTEPPLRSARRWEAGATIGRASGSPWADLVWLPCRDGKARPVESRYVALADGLSDQLGYHRNQSGCWTLQPLITQTTNRVGRLRGYGNAINIGVAVEFIKAYAESLQAERKETIANR